MKRIMNYPHLMKIVILASGVMIAGSIVMLTAEMSRHHRFETCSFLYQESSRKWPYIRDAYGDAKVYNDVERLIEYCGIENPKPTS